MKIKGEMKYDIKRGAQIYRAIYATRLQSWISLGKIKCGEALVWRSGLSGWRKAEELEELAPFFERWEKRQLQRIKKQRKQPLPEKRPIKNILMIDDEKDLCSLLKDGLSQRGYNIALAHTRKEGLVSLKKEKPDLVFLDLKLPDGDGMKILSKINKINPKPVVNIISAYGSEERRGEAKKNGVYNFIAKPFTEEQILRSIKKLEK